MSEFLVPVVTGGGAAVIELDATVERHLDELAAELSTGIVAIDGPSGAGKSVIADALVSKLAARGTGAVLIRTDDFATWDNPVAWWPELEDDILRPFFRRRDYVYRPRVWRGGVPSAGRPVWVRWEPLLIIEGVSSARTTIAPRLTRALWVDGGTEAQRLARTVARDGEAEREHLMRWQRFERGWFGVDRTRERCLILD